ncbi:MAG TPA: UvrD-helicase domain-containing protein [Nocardioidaceae bacterium]|nr:UvrD-helicase domain-containing protein [Nocardioidaceae bacterium]
MGAPTFDPCGPLPQGTTVLEASAGTGKTHTIATLAVRYVAEGRARIDELMLVTFGRAATVELRERVRERFVGAAAALSDPAAVRAGSDPVLALLATGPDHEVADRRHRLVQAVADFDAATIATTHGFCQQMLSGLGIAADVDPGLTFAESTADVTTEVVTDLYVRAYGRSGSARPPFPLGAAAGIGLSAVGDRQARLEPRDAEPDSEPDVRRRLAETTRAQVQERKRRRRVMDYDDLLVQLRDALVDPTTGPDARARVRGRYAVVMVDEFQDTDPVQWQILESAFHGHRALVLIGDPKQAIYAFRGADVVTYLVATGSAGDRETLGTNWRSDAPLLRALEHVMDGVSLGDERIRVHPVAAAHPGRRLRGAHLEAPLRIRVVERALVSPDEDGVLKVGPARAWVARDVAADIVALLASAARLGDGGGPDAGRPVQPGDVAVLVQTNRDGAAVRDALEAVRVPVVLTGTSSVFLSEAAGDWLTLLTALEQPQRAGLARSAALTAFVGWPTARLAAEDDTVVDDLSALLHGWGELLARAGVAALLEAAAEDMVPRVLAREHGERRLTDLRHIGQVLHAAATEGRFGVASMVEWLQHRMVEAAADQTEERSRRLESDAAAVQVITVHRSKGLEFPVVYAPFLWDRFVPTSPDPLLLHDTDGTRLLDVGGPGDPGYPARRAEHAREDAGEALRLAYVALTRASAQVVVHWAPTSNTRSGPLHRLLFAERTAQGAPAESAAVGTDAFVRRRLDELAAGSGGTVAVETSVPEATRWHPPGTPHPTLAVRSFDRVLDLAWTRTSYSGLTAGLHEAAQSGVHSEAEEPGTVDEVEVSVPTGRAARVDATAPASPMAGLPRGAAFGTLVHSVLENTDFTAPDLRSRLADEAERAGTLAATGVAADTLAEALEPAILTPLGPLAGGRRLADIGRRDRLDELGFELPLAGGDRPVGGARVAEVADLLRAHLRDDDPMRAYADDLAVPLLAARQLRGFLNGSIDTVLRVRDGDRPAYLVVDYKTNWLGGDRLTSADYVPAAMARAMREAHYPLQALLYSVALHRYLRWRQPGYDPDVHLGGVLYLFLRGMCGADTPVVDGMTCGVFSWSPPAALVVDLSALLAGGAG